MIAFFVILIIILLVFLLYASASIRSGVYVKAVCRLDTKEKQLALTFDDGPDPDITPQILDILSNYQIQAVFFCIGQQIPGNEALLKQMATEGHLIGNHTYSHASFFPLFSINKMKKAILECEKQIESATGQKAIQLFRPPFGVTNPNIGKAIKSLNYKTIGWSLRSLDTMHKNPQTVIRRVTKKLQTGDIVLFHDNLKNSPEIVEAVIQYALQKGYRFVQVNNS
jgi:peptidoglycan/xylan/chitin deacetylase (PgdA/CDA1 family)